MQRLGEASCRTPSHTMPFVPTLYQHSRLPVSPASGTTTIDAATSKSTDEDDPYMNLAQVTSRRDGGKIKDVTGGGTASEPAPRQSSSGRSAGCIGRGQGVKVMS